MVKYKIIGIMTGNSMDAIDVVLTEFDGDYFHDICSYSEPYSEEQKQRINSLRNEVMQKKLTATQLNEDDNFIAIHDDYIQGIALAVQNLLKLNHIDKNIITAIGFHGKTLDHNPPSQATKNGILPFTTQMGSGQMLADILEIPVISDFRSPLIMNGLEGAPLAGPHNAHIAKIEGSGIYYNAGNTANLAGVTDGKNEYGWDVGPFNEYTDSFILQYKNKLFDKDAYYGLQGQLMPDLLQDLFECGKEYYEQLPPKSGDPSFYKTAEIFAHIEQKYGNPQTDNKLFCDVIHTLEYFSGYLATYALCQISQNAKFVPQIILFGGGWRNKVAFNAFNNLLNGESYILPQHQEKFAELKKRGNDNFAIKYSKFGTYMEARLFADMARFYLEKKAWPTPENMTLKTPLILGDLHEPFSDKITDRLSKATCGWQLEK